ncbi:tetraacyldisaccharide 4'-kinase [Rhodalgimonas zhirmunskyi]|uniref:Tetraacyldisaccharide 4'-kinase n=1 Tax=Rhodalgimonas zhirmunskyi TaxID=2964767 RepID=A0AAJ1UAN5_9RHOB|nr:tetraacyldisaccharide 4'-kinase [Rhodoalgimonas zhirmunskyi]MDQ2094408.1 tetraacyldisaccharide 4'-kinase [Rhodoalgimonas zhirmunskyi]
MQAPDFWENSPDAPGWKARALAPLGWLYGRATARRVRQDGARVGVPVICIGNLNAGGVGKTPTVIALGRKLIEQGLNIHVVSRGYGGSAEGPLRVDPARDEAGKVGDEPLLMAAFFPVWVAKDRAEGCRHAAKAGADLILLDDGHQNPSVFKDLTMIVVDAEVGFGNGRCIPAGPLREPVKAGLARADAVLSIGPPEAQESFSKQWGSAISLPHLKGVIRPVETGMEWPGLKAVAFAGIGRPEKFFNTLRGMGVDLIATHALADHQEITPALFNRLKTEANSKGLPLVTTEKDMMRLPVDLRRQVVFLPVALEVEDWSPLEAMVQKLTAKRPG